MHVDITGHHLPITTSLRDYVNEKIDRIQRHFAQITDAHVVLTVEKQRHKAEATLQLPGTRVFAEVEQDDMYAAIDALADKLDRQVRKHKEKLTDHHAREGRAQTAVAQMAAAVI